MLLYTVFLFISLSLINIAHCNMLAQCGFYRGDFLKMLSERGGRALYLPLVSVFCFLAAFVLWEIALWAGILLLIAGAALSAAYMLRTGRSEYSRLSRFVVSECISLAACVLGHLSGGAVLCMLPVLSVFIALISNAFWLKMTFKKRFAEYAKRSEALSGSSRLLVLTAHTVKVDVPAVLRRLCENEDDLKIYGDVRAELLYRNMPEKCHKMVFCAEISSLAETLSLLKLISPEYVIITGQKGQTDKRLSDMLEKCRAVYCDNDALLHAKNVIVPEETMREDELSKEEGSVLACCIAALMSMGIDGKTLVKRKNVLLGTVEK